MTDFVTNADLALTKMREVYSETPLQRNDYLSARYEAEVYRKREDASAVRSYKIRGAFNAMRKSLAAKAD